LIFIGLGETLIPAYENTLRKSFLRFKIRVQLPFAAARPLSITVLANATLPPQKPIDKCVTN